MIPHQHRHHIRILSRTITQINTNIRNTPLLNSASTLSFSTFGNNNGNNRNPPYPPNMMRSPSMGPPSSTGPNTRGPPGSVPPGRTGPPGTPATPPKPMGIIGAEEIKRKQAAEAKAASNSNPSTSTPSSSKSSSVSSGSAAPLKPEELIVDVNASNFAQVVLQSPVAVILDCWADWCQPCKQLTPRLEAVVKAARGAVRLAKLNVDEQPAIAQQLQVRSLPTVFGIVGGRSVDAFQGMVPDDRLRAFMEKLISAAESSGMVPNAAGAPSNPIEEAEDMIANSHTQLDNGSFEEALRTIPEILTTLQAVEQKFISEAAKKDASSSSSAPSSSSSETSSSTTTKKKVIAPNPVPQPIQDLTARALAALVRAYVVSAQAAGSNVMKGQGTSNDSIALYEKAKGYATLLKEKYRGSASIPEVQRALSAADLASGAATAISQLAPLLDEVKVKPNDISLKLKLAEAQLGLGQNEQALETAYDILQGINNKTITLSPDQITPTRDQTRTFIVKIFDTLGATHPLVIQGRKKLSKLLFR